MFPCWSAFLSRWPFGGTCALVWLGLNGFPMSCHKLTHGGSCVTPLSLKVGELGGRDCSMGPGCPYVVELSVYARGWKFLPGEDFFFPPQLLSGQLVLCCVHFFLLMEEMGNSWLLSP